MVVTITKYSLQILLVFHFYIVYNVKLDYIIKNTSWLPHPVFEPRTIFMWNKKELFCPQLRLRLDASSIKYFLFSRILHESIEYINNQKIMQFTLVFSTWLILISWKDIFYS